MSRRKYILLLFGLVMLSLVVLYPMLFLPRVEVVRDKGTPAEEPMEQEMYRSMVYKELNVTVSMSSLELLELERFSRVFQQEYPGLFVNIQNIPYQEAYETLKTAARIGESPDVMLLDTTWVHDFAAHGLLKPADAVYTGETLSDHLQGLLQPLKWNGYIWGVPKDADPLVIVWNSKLLRDAGMEAPPATWSEFVRVTGQLADMEAGGAPATNWVNLDPDDARQWMVWLSSLEKTATDPMAPGPIGGDRLERIGFMDLNASRVSELSLNYESNQLKAAMEKGTVLSAVVTWSVASSMDGVVVLGGESAEQPLWINGRSFVISSATEMEEDARMWINYITEVDRQKIFYEHFRKLPTRVSLYGRLTPDTPPDWLRQRLEAEPESSPDPEWLQQFLFYESLWKQWREGALAQDLFIEEWNKEAS
ncbi:ABC transporter substrate-binding protein [Paenibacillus tarimensis]